VNESQNFDGFDFPDRRRHRTNRAGSEKMITQSMGPVCDWPVSPVGKCFIFNGRFMSSLEGAAAPRKAQKAAQGVPGRLCGIAGCLVVV
jgi:hypothetical protein